MGPDLHRVQFSRNCETCKCVAEYSCNSMVFAVPLLDKCVSLVWTPIYQKLLGNYCS